MDGSRGALAAPGLLVFLFAGVGFVAAQVPPAQVLPPTVSPTFPDLGSPNGDPEAIFNDFSWRSFVAVNWPAIVGAADRGKPDRTKDFGDAAGPRVWTTWKSRYEIFQRGGAAPSPWASYQGENPCGPGFANDVVTRHSFQPFSDFNQADIGLKKVSNPLVAQNRTYVRYEVRVNEPEFNSIVDHKWYLASNLPTKTTWVPFNIGSTAVKAAWRILTDKDTPAIRARYYVVPGAAVFDERSGKCTARDIALVGLHIVTKTEKRPQWIWSSFEHVDNVPGLTSEPKPPEGVPFSFYDPNGPATLSPEIGPRPVSSSNPPDPNQLPVPMQVVRQQPISRATMKMNEAYWNLPPIKGTVWQNYMLVSTQWPNEPQPESPSSNGVPSESVGYAMSNTTMETYFQRDDTGATCMFCHNKANQAGRDWVMFVTTDAFSPSEPTPPAPVGNQVTGGGSPPAGHP
jgi:hypothetical protein